MEDLEMVPEAIETTESTEISKLQETLQAQLEAAQEAGNVEKANFYSGEISRLNELSTQVEGASEVQERGHEISFGSTKDGFSGHHSETYWKEKAGKEYAEHGNSPSYKYYIKRAGEAKANSLD